MTKCDFCGVEAEQLFEEPMYELSIEDDEPHRIEDVKICRKCRDEMRARVRKCGNKD